MLSGIVSIDEINKLGIERRSEDYEDYFSDMDLTEQQKDERVSFSKDTENVLLFIMALISIMNDFGEIDKQYVSETLAIEFRSIVASYSTVDDYLDLYIHEFSETFIDTTLENLADIWFMSEDRAMFDAENEANTTLNYKDYMKAIMSGKKEKTWITYGDNRVRKSHVKMDGKTIPIKSLFDVNGSFMLYPKDMSRSPRLKEIINCRCSCKYS